jgi:enamine deaminase RidA (YjgF/YER057c/UK114 family)
MSRRTITSGSPYEPILGISRAVVDGHHVAVSGTAPIMPNGVEPPVDAHGQARRVLEIIVTALAEAGARPEHVIRTRTYLTDANDWRDVGRAHGELFGDARPVSTVVVVTGFIDPRWIVEIEADAILPETR